MKVLFSNNKTEKICSDFKKAIKEIGDKKIALHLFSIINSMRNAVKLEDFIYLKKYRFHALSVNLKNCFVVDIFPKTKWRLIFKFLDENEQEFNPCDLQLIKNKIKIIKIETVSEHYDDIY